jgi:hypothetical protein
MVFVSYLFLFTLSTCFYLALLLVFNKGIPLKPMPFVGYEGQIARDGALDGR